MLLVKVLLATVAAWSGVVWLICEKSALDVRANCEVIVDHEIAYQFNSSCVSRACTPSSMHQGVNNASFPLFCIQTLKVDKVVLWFPLRQLMPVVCLYISWTAMVEVLL